MVRRWWIGLVPVVAAGAVLAARRRADRRAAPFDPDVVGRRESEAWVAYYRREWLRMLVAVLGMVAAGFRMGPRDTVAGAWHVLRANQAWAPSDNDPDAARRHMAVFYRLMVANGWELDPVRAAELEVEWWRVHRLHQHAEGPDADALTDALDALYSEVHAIPAGQARVAAGLRMRAMEVSDRWVEAGADRGDPMLTQERALLVASYAALRAATASRRA